VKLSQPEKPALEKIFQKGKITTRQMPAVAITSRIPNWNTVRSLCAKRHHRFTAQETIGARALRAIEAAVAGATLYSAKSHAATASIRYS